jgi:hypothetical protein
LNSWVSRCDRRGNYPNKMPRVSKDKLVAIIEMDSVPRAHNTELHVAILRKRKKVLAVATNRIGSRSRGCGYSTMTIHAERAVLKMVDARELHGAEMYVVRLTTARRDIIGSEPCHSCKCHLEKCFREHGLRRVYYSE